MKVKEDVSGDAKGAKVVDSLVCDEHREKRGGE